MRTLNGEMSIVISSKQIEFLTHIQFLGEHILSKSLRLIHDIARYHSKIPLGDVEKSALLDIRILWEELELLNAKSAEEKM